MFKSYFKIACRNIWNQKLIGFINIGGLAVSMATVMLILVWIQNELSFDSYHSNANKIYLLKNTWEINKENVWIKENSFYPLGSEIEKTTPGVEVVTRMERLGNGKSVSANNRLFSLDKAIRVDDNWFKVFNYDFKDGNAPLFYSNTQNAIVTESESNRLFGKGYSLGKTFYLDGKPLTVAGVVEDNPINSSFQFDIILQIDKLDPEYNNWQYLNVKTFVKVDSSADVAAIEKKINDYNKSNSKAEGKITVSMLPLQKLRFENNFINSAFSHTSYVTVTIFGILCFLLLLTAAINYVNLFMAQITKKAKEISVRKITGAKRWQLFIQMMTEAVVVSLSALLLSLMIVILSLPLLNTLSGINFEFDSFKPDKLLILISITLGIILLTGLYPALMLSSFKPMRLLKGNVGFGVKSSSSKKVLLTTQFVLAIFMIVAVLVIYNQMSFMQRQNNNYDRSQVFKVEIPSSEFHFSKVGEEQRLESTLETVKHELLETGFISIAARTNLTSLINYGFTISGGVDWDGKPKEFNPEYIDYSMDADLNKLIHLKLLQGRWFDEQSVTDKQNVILNETAVKNFKLKEPVIGRRFNKGVIIGIVKDFNHQTLHQKIASLVIRTGGTNSENFIIQAKPGKVREGLADTELLWKKFFPGASFQYAFADEEFASLYRKDQNALKFAFAFSGLCILISCLGLLGLGLFTIEQRRKEIGIRKIMGATINNIFLLITKDSIRIILVAFIIAAPIAWWLMNKWLQQYEYRISVSWWTIAIAGLFVLFIALSTLSLQAIKAALANPVKSLRTE